MSIGTLGPTSLNLSDRVTFDGSVASQLVLVGNGGSDVAVDNVNNCTTSGFFNTGTVIGGHAVILWGERGTGSVGSTLAMGNGINSTAVQPIQPQSGRVVAVTGTFSTSVTVTWTVYVNGVAQALSIVFSGATKAQVTGNIPFSANQQVWLQITSGSYSNGNCRMAMFIVYD